MTIPDGTSSVEQPGGKSPFLLVAKADRLRRIERIAIRLFGVANCMISCGGDVAARFSKGERSVAALEASFCDSVGFSNEPVWISDARSDPDMAANPWVVGEPYVRFFASQPVFQNNKVVGAIFLIDYEPRQYQDDDTYLLNDLADLVEQELLMDALHASQSEMTRQNRLLRRESMLDSTLGTWNRAAIIRSLEIEVSRCKAAAKAVSLALVSIDHYDAWKTEHGSTASESILIKLISRIRSCIRPFDALGRFGTDEFLIVLPGTTHVVIQAIAERLHSTVLAHPESVNDQPVNVAVSIGSISTDIFPDASPEDLINLVEQTLLSAKQSSMNRVVHAKPLQS